MEIREPKTVWDLKNGDTYYLIDVDGEVINATWNNDNIDNNSIQIGNAFLTREEAEFEVERRKIETEMIWLGGRRKFGLGKANWYLEYRPMSGGIEAMWTTYEMGQGTIYYESEEKAKKVVEIIGKDIIKKYIFLVDEWFSINARIAIDDLQDICEKENICPFCGQKLKEEEK